MKYRVLDGQDIKGSKFFFVMAAAKRSKQINRMAKERGLPPNQVASIKTGFLKAPTIAITEILEGKISYRYVDKKKVLETENSLPASKLPKNGEAEGEKGEEEFNIASTTAS